MNLTEALDTSLPEIPVLTREFRPRIHPHLIWKEHLEDGKKVITCLVPEKSYVFNLTPDQWEFFQLFDGQRTVQEIVDEYRAQTGTSYTPDEVRESISALEQAGFWYKTPLEMNIALRQRLVDERKKKTDKKSKYGDLSHMTFGGWDPDRTLDYLHPKLKFIYSRWFAVLSAAGFIFMLYVFYDRWAQIGHDTLLFYNFREKTFRDIVEFWCLSCLVLFFHEGAHGLTCKHYGGHVHKMGFLLLYLTPAFYTDATEVFVYGSKWQRVNTIFWGAWSEIMICALATPVWWGTPPGSLVHEWAYKLMLITGLAVFFFNWNPLIKLDGYYLMTEILGWPDLKEASTAYVASWVKKHVWRLPFEVPFVPRRQRITYVVYALLSGAYSYLLLFGFARFIGNIVSSFSPNWGFLVTILVAYRIFRSRILALGRFMNVVYLDKRERVKAWLTPQRRLMAAIAIALLLFLPMWPESVEGRFLLEPAKRAVLRAAVPGTVVEVNADEGQSVAAGATLLRLRSLSLETAASRAKVEFQVANARATQAQLRYADFGVADRERQQLAERSRLLDDQVSMLTIKSPVAGQVMTPRVRDRLGSYVKAGTELAEVADLSTLRARIYLPEFEVRKLPADLLQHPQSVARPAEEGSSRASLLPDSSVSSVPGVVRSLAPASSEIEEGLIEQSRFRGIRPPPFYVVDVEVDNSKGSLRPGMSGTALIPVGHRSIVGGIFGAMWDFVRRKVW